MLILLMSDSHMFNENLSRITNKYKDQVDLMIHCGDSSLDGDDPLMKPFDVVVKGNHDDYDYPITQIIDQILITHGQYFHVYKGYDELIQECINNNCHICFHGHTHVPTLQIHNGITFINPGSIMMNRGSYGYGTYALVEINDDITVHFYNSDDDTLCSHQIIEEGLELLEEFKKLV